MAILEMDHMCYVSYSPTEAGDFPFLQLARGSQAKKKRETNRRDFSPMSKLKAEDNLKHVPCRKVALADNDPENMKTSGFPRQ